MNVFKFDEETVNEFVLELKRKNEHTNRWINKFIKYYENNPDIIIEKLINKYYSEKYRNKEYSLGYEPREELLWLIFSYADKHENLIEYTPEIYGAFGVAAYKVGSYRFVLLQGQGSALIVEKII